MEWRSCETHPAEASLLEVLGHAKVADADAAAVGRMVRSLRFRWPEVALPATKLGWLHP